ncbi:MAG: amidohydrolase [Acidimicrobiia bacterium]|jgi:predicted amidohydrolase YtcJ
MAHFTRSIRLVLATGLILAVAGTAAVTAQSAAQPSPATLVLHNGRIVTVDDTRPDAQAIAVNGDTIVALGTNAEIRRYIGPQTQVIDLNGQMAMPGFVESHGHFNGIGQAKLGLELMNTKSWQEIVGMVRDAAAKARPGQWIVGRGWHQEKWTSVPEPNVAGFPLHHELSAAAPNNPVVLTHASGHASFVNAKAMELSNITRASQAPRGGEILKDKDGNPSGLLNETAMGLVRRGAGEPPPTPEEREAEAMRVIELADQEILSKGVTSFQDAGSSFQDVERFKRAIDTGKLRSRLWVMIRGGGTPEQLSRGRLIDYGNKHLTVRAIKITIDGALGSRGAWLLAPYSDSVQSAGLGRDLEPVRTTAQLAVDHGYQLCLHAIGDRANREALDIYEEAFVRNNRVGKDLRWRVEHAQHIHRDDIPRFAELGVIAAMQGIHATSDAPYVEARLGAERAQEGAYVWKSLVDKGVVVANGTDAPVEDVDPIASYYATVTRRTASGQVFYPAQRLSRIEALKSYTLWAAFAGFEEHQKGSLTPGKLADITVLTKDITTVPDDQIRDAKVAYTIVGGKVVFQSQR